MTASKEPIAIVGSACRFPGGANSPSKLWELLRNPRDLRTKIPPSRFDVDGFHHPDNSFPGHSNVKHSHLLDENVRHFDSHFFSIAPAEAAAMDPQQRLLLETVYEGLETSGFTIEGLRGSNTAVYVGVMFGDYENVQIRDLQHFPTYHATGTARSIMSNRVSYFFDWHGPSWTVDTACSSSLVAVHQAVQSLRSGEVNVAVAAGTNIILGPEAYVSESKVKMLSPDGRSRMWDIDANGYARGEGIAAVFLKTLSAALADGDNIECIIRETGVNQDGRSRGITMPSATAQATLIRETYARAGLDPIKDRCQYFEAHGTGTPAGDPVEAEAVHTAFFGHKKPEDEKDSSPLYVGSIKTIIGHTESTAGLAGILKVAQALKNGFIPPNRLLNKLNPDVLPFYDHLQIPQELIPWPELSPGQVRRASVNSFGFGGTNAHAIIERYEPERPKINHAPAFAPFVFSAQSKQSLAANIAAYANYLKENPETNPADLSWTLRSRRSRLPLRVTFPASSIEDLGYNLENLSKSFQLDPRLPATDNDRSKLLGVFTGQGAQYARMGAELIETSAHASKLLSELDGYLSQLPAEDRPPVSLRQELFEAADTSRVATAAVSQPLCTAVQIVLVDLLRLAGIHFSAVVGHSSGEIAAAYAAGYLSAADAICIAYYRGLHTHLAAGENGSQGAMLAVGTSQEDADEVCSDEQFKGRVNVAACNSPASVTLSGDEEAIEEIKTLFEDEGKFVRRLRVDKAYHSHHMLRCSQAYLDSIKRFSTVPNSDGSCTWVSSVDPEREPSNMAPVDASYWVDNMVSPVLFKQAVERASTLGPFDGAIEVGPHPALKGPVRETLQSLQVDIPYTALLHRQNNAIQSFSGALGYLWSQVDNLKIDFDAYEQAVGGLVSYNLIKGLPAYQWNHPQEYWHESPLSRRFRQRSNTVHPLLGDLSPQSSANQLIWKLLMRPKDLPWVHGHQVQGQTVFPAAGYISTALETVPFIVGDASVKLVEIENIRIHQAMVLDNENEEAGIDVQFSVNNINRGPEYITAHFTYEATIGTQGVFDLISSGQLSIILGESSTETLPASSLDEPYMVPVPSDKLYSELKDIGYGYSGPFRALDSIMRKLWKASGSISVINDESQSVNYAVHPGLLDAAFHSVILALSYPGDRQLWSLHIPTSIDKIRFNPALCGEYWLHNDKVPFVASAQDPSQVGGYQGDAEVHSSDGRSSAIQIEGMKVVPLSEATKADDREMFHLMHWVDAEANADILDVYKATPAQRELANIFMRASCFYLREIQKEIPEDHPGRSDKFNAAYLDFAAHNTKLCQEGKHRYNKREWLNDTWEDILALTEPHAHLVEVRALRIVGEHMPRAIRGETNMVEQLLMTGLLDDYYAAGLGYKEAVEALADTVKQIVQRYPNMNILEVGSGTGSATRLVFDRIGHEFSNFTYTDISTGFFGNAQEEFKGHKDQMTYAVLDLEQDLQGQGFKKHSYDMILSSLVVHATKHLEDTMRRVRSLLKPGGYLVMTECTDVDASQFTTLFGCLPGWWLGMEEGRKWGPFINESDWDSLLRKVGFSGIETMTPTDDAMVFPNSVIVSRAVDDWIDFVREPLLAQSSLFTGRPVIDSLFIVGGSSFRNSRLIDEMQRHVGVYCENITHVKLLENLDHTAINSGATVLVLQDLDQPVFQNMTEERFESIKKLFGSEKSIIWVTQNRLCDNPYANLPVGFARSALLEVAELRYQFIDFEGVHKIDARMLSEAVLRFEAAGSPRQQSQRNALWSVEQEIIINADGQQRIPRLRPYSEANDRFNSSRRNIIKEADPEDVSLEISKKNGRYVITEHSTPVTALFGSSEDMLQLKSSHMSSQAIKTPIGDAFVVLGNCTSTGAQYLGLTQSPGSLINMARETLISHSVPSGSEAAFVRLVTANLLLLTISDGLSKGDTLLINDSPAIIATLLNRQVSTTGVNTTYTSSSKTDSTKRGWLHVDRYHRRSHLKSILPRNVSRFVDFSSHSSSIPSCLPSYTSILNTSVLFPEVIVPHPSHSEFSSKWAQTLTQAAQSALEDLETPGPMASAVINVQELSGREIIDPLTIIEWEASSIPVTVEPVKYHFRHDRTYWLVGLTGDMGLSIANWMIQSGAKNLVLTSRNPKIEKAWLTNAENQGAMVRVMKNDILDFGDLERAHREIVETMPPIAGVAQGAMVIRDAAIREMTFDELMQSLRPKVEGSLNLDRLFHDEPLDFFVFLSSSVSVIGHTGQANYTAGNAFMCGLAEQRRHRGLNASAMNLGPVLGTGYITRELSQWGSQSAFERGFVTLSESDVHHTVAEAIHSSQCTSGAKSQVTTGLRYTPATDATRALWYTFPQFSCMTLREFGNGAAASSGQEGIPLSEQLTNALTQGEVREIILDTFTTDLRNMLMLGNDYELTPSVRTDELGLDSLVAVRVRSWFLNNFQVNIPVLKVLKGVSIQNLVDQTLDEMPQSLTPNIGNPNSPEPASSEQAPSNNASETTSEKQETPPSSYPHTPTEELDKEFKEEVVPKQKITRWGELSYSQSMFLFAHRLLNDKTTMNTTAMVNFRGDIRVSDLRQAIETIVKRHESLRTCFYERDGQFVQGVMEYSPLTLEHKKIYNKKDLFKEYESLGKFVYDLSAGQAMRFILLSYSPRDHYFLLGYHHIIFDRTSQNAFMAELQQLYDGRNVPFEPLQYLDWSNQQHEVYRAGRWKAMIDFWRREFTTVPEPLPLHRSLISARLPLEEYSFHTKQVRIQTEMAGAVRDVARKHRSTPFHLHLAVFKALLYRFLGSTDICIGVTDNGRMDDSMQTGIGPFVNTVFVRMSASGEQTFGDAVKEARDKSISALSNPLPLELIFNVTQVTRASTHTPLGQAFLNYSEVELQDGDTFLGCKTTTMDQHPAKLPYDITCTVVNHGAGHTDVWLNVQQALYTEEDAQLLVHGYEDILAELTKSPTDPVGDEWQFRESIVQYALTVGRGQTFKSTWPQTLVHRFHAIAKSFASRVAVKDSNENSLTYAALLQGVDAIASELLRGGVQPGSRVAIFQHPSVHWATSVLAILKVGGVYVPLDASNPVGRLALIVQDSQPTTILVHEHTIAAAEGLEAPSDTTIINISQIPEQAAQNVPILAEADSPAIILYTSGSTGVPKGVILQHASLKHEFDHCAATYGLNENDVVLQQSAWSFDLSVTQIFLALEVGATLQIASHTMRPDAQAMTGLIKAQGVTATYATPTEYKSWLRRENQQSLRSGSWKLALVAGEAVTEPLLQLFREIDLPNHRLFNVYGPTETTCGSTKLELDYKTPGLYSKSVPVGRASANESFYILDRSQKLLPCGQPGEVAIAGVGVAMGYLNNEERTQASFLSDPYAPSDYIENGWVKMYRTGDLGFLQQDGTLILQGRIEGDTEVKLNGVRIDLGDIEQTVLKAADGRLSDAIASLRSASDDQAKFMVVHVVFSSESSAADKSTFLGGLLADLPLPRTMRPSAIVPVDSLPRTVAGKVDRKAVSQWAIPGVLGGAAENTALSKAEAAMKCMWEAVLPNELIGLHQVNADSDFFAVGGSSMSLIELQSKIKEKTGVLVPLLRLFQNSSLRGMSGLIGSDELERINQIDWDSEVSLQPELASIQNAAEAVLPQAQPQVIVLTGSTGFLGQHIARELSAQSHVQKVICIAMRNPNQKRAAFTGIGKIECHEGDLRLPRLGLSEEAAKSIFEQADAVVHNGADVSHLKNYNSLRTANVQSTQELVKLCLPRKVPLHFVSSTAVSMYSDLRTFSEISMRTSPPPTDGHDGYSSSKWASEIYLENVHAAYGLPVHIHRPSSIIRPREQLTGDDPVDDVIQGMLEYSRRISAVPVVPGTHGTLDLVKPETVAKKLVRAAMAQHPSNEVTYVHESGDLVLKDTEMADYVAKQSGDTIAEVSLEEWISRAQAAGLSKSLVAVFQGLGTSRLNFPEVLTS